MGNDNNHKYVMINDKIGWKVLYWISHIDFERNHVEFLSEFYPLYLEKVSSPRKHSTCF